jgi:succinate dehydrogenase / fumarate reductase cytochrome b subunit
MTSSPVVKKPRPLSPHVQIYKPQITSGMSIFHRITGVGLSFALPVFVWFLVALAGGQSSYDTFVSCAHSTVGRIFLMGWAWAFFYHFCCGIRHLFWDAGLFLDIKQVNQSGIFCLFLSTALTLAIAYNLFFWTP